MAARTCTASTTFGKVSLALFLLMQCLDGVLTYLGVVTFGIAMEGNPIVAGLMQAGFERLGSAAPEEPEEL